jgi:hypothetical protein
VTGKHSGESVVADATFVQFPPDLQVGLEHGMALHGLRRLM